MCCPLMIAIIFKYIPKFLILTKKTTFLYNFLHTAYLFKTHKSQIFMVFLFLCFSVKLHNKFFFYFKCKKKP